MFKSKMKKIVLGITVMATMTAMTAPALAAPNTACGASYCGCPNNSSIITYYCDHWAQPIENGRGTFFGCYRHNGGYIVWNW